MSLLDGNNNKLTVNTEKSGLLNWQINFHEHLMAYKYNIYMYLDYLNNYQLHKLWIMIILEKKKIKMFKIISVLYKSVFC